ANLQPNASPVGRQSSASPPSNALANNQSSAAGSSGNISITAAQPNRATTAGSASAGSSSTQAPQLARASGGAKSDISPAQVDVPSLAAGPASTEPASDPVRLSVSRASGGAPGLTRQRNFDSEMPGKNPSDSVASTSARRATPTQQTAPGSMTSP